jgi:hypothetical protein
MITVIGNTLGGASTNSNSSSSSSSTSGTPSQSSNSSTGSTGSNNNSGSSNNSGSGSNSSGTNNSSGSTGSNNNSGNSNNKNSSGSGTNPTNGGTVDFNPNGTPTPIGQTAEQGTSVTNNSSGTWTNLNVSDLTNPVFSYDPSKSNCDGQNLAAGASCNIYVTFDPIASGEQDDTFTVSYTDQNGASQSVSYDLTANAAAGSTASTNNCTAAAIGGVNLSVPSSVTVDPSSGGSLEYTITPDNSSAASCQITIDTYVLANGVNAPASGQQPDGTATGFGTNTVNIPASDAGAGTVTIYSEYTDSSGASINTAEDVNIIEASNNGDNGTDSNGSTDNGSNDDGGDE